MNQNWQAMFVEKMIRGLVRKNEERLKEIYGPPQRTKALKKHGPVWQQAQQSKDVTL